MTGICLKRIHIMNKREISEIKKQFKKDNNAITRICGCYVDAEKQIKTTLKEAFFALSEEEIFKYYEIFKKSLSGGIGKNLHNLEYSIHDEGPDSAHELLMKLRDEKLADDETVDSFYNKVIENYEYGENYYIILIHSAYDVPGKASDNEEMFDASEEVYNHILCCICPVKLSEPGLSYNETTNAIEERPRDWWVQTPMTGFLFPAFNDRSSDIHSVLYFSKNPEELHSEFIDACLGAPTPISFKSQKEAFQEILTDTLGEECNYETVRQVASSSNALVSDTSNMLDDVSNVARYLAQTTDQMDYLIEDTKALKDSLDVYYPDLQSALDDSKELVNRTTDALNNSTNSLTLVQNTVRASSDSLDAAAKDSIKGSLNVLNKSLNVLDSTSSMRKAGRTMKDTMDNEWSDLEDDTNFLNMDPSAEKVSFTSDENAEPNTLQIIMRTEEISVDDDAELLDAETEKAAVNPLQRMWNMLVQMWKAIVEIFKNR